MFKLDWRARVSIRRAVTQAPRADWVRMELLSLRQAAAVAEIDMHLDDAYLL